MTDKTLHPLREKEGVTMSGAREGMSAPESPARASSIAANRREFLGKITTAAAALAMTPGLTNIVAGPAASAASAARRAVGKRAVATAGPFSDAWLGKLTGKHKEFFDTLDANDGFALAFAMHFLDLNREMYGLSDEELTAVVGLRHVAMPMALPDALWDRYQIGESMQIKDPATGGPATRNPFLHADGSPAAGADIPSLMKRGVIFTVCNVALTTLSSRLAKNAGVSGEAAKAEWAAKLMPGMTLVPVGVMAVNLAQERGCTYCYGG
jgi:intracellular sulfur oxidation DsrE/DsrF family protein